MKHLLQPGVISFIGLVLALTSELLHVRLLGIFGASMFFGGLIGMFLRDYKITRR